MNFKAEKTTLLDRRVVCLSGGKGTEAVISPEMGANILRYSAGGHRIIWSPDEEIMNGVTYQCGNPVLFPTPNRVRNCTTIYRGREYVQMKGGERHFLHSFVYDAEFMVESLESGEDFARVVLSFEMKKGDEVLESFPFENKLTLTYTLEAESLTLAYSVKNNSDAEMPFGFAIHPYFYFDKDVLFQIPSDTMLELDSEKIPTRRFLKTEEQLPGINKGILATEVKLDNDLIRRGSENAVFTFTDSGTTVTLEATEEFRHFVVYTPETGAEFICIENQTCSIDGHNMFLDGFQKESGILFAPPGREMKGSVIFRVEKDVAN